MKNVVSLNACLAAATVTVLSVTTPTASRAAQYDMCSWEEIPTHVLKRIEGRSDYNDILERMFENCPISALALTDRPTASIDIGFASDVPDRTLDARETAPNTNTPAGPTSDDDGEDKEPTETDDDDDKKGGGKKGGGKKDGGKKGGGKKDGGKKGGGKKGGGKKGGGKKDGGGLPG